MSDRPPAYTRMGASLLTGCLLSAVALQCLPAGASAEAGHAGFPVQRLAVDSWVYEDLEKLLLLGLVEPVSLDTRPLGRGDIALLLAEGMSADPAFASNPVASRLLREFAWELKQLGFTSPHRDTKAMMLLGTEDRFMRNRVFTAARLEAAPGTRGSFGELSRLGFELSAFLTPSVCVFEDLFATEVENSRSVGDALIAHTDILLMSERAYVTLRSKHLDLCFGRDNVRWGPGRKGTLAISDSAPPFFMFSYRGRLGRSLTGEAFHGTLNAFEGRYLAGHRVELNLGRSLSIGLAEVARYDSPTVEPLYLIGIVPYSLVEKLLYRDSGQTGTEGDNQRNNIMQAIDVSWRPSGRLELYGEFLADDVATESGDMPSRIAYQLGAKKAWSAPCGLLLLQGEYTRVWNYTYSVYYGRDFVHRDRPIGYAEGPDSESLTAWLTADPSIDWSFEVEISASRKGEGTIGQPWCPEGFDGQSCAAHGRTDASSLSGIVEERQSVTVRSTWRPRDNIAASLGLSAVRVESEGHVEGRNRTYPALQAFLSAKW